MTWTREVDKEGRQTWTADVWNFRLWFEVREDTPNRWYASLTTPWELDIETECLKSLEEAKQWCVNTLEDLVSTAGGHLD